MTWIRRVLAHFPTTRRLVADEKKRDERVRRALSEADPVIREYKKLDGALRIYIERRQHPR